MATYDSVLLNKELAASQAILKADDEPVVMRIKYIGSEASGTVQVAATTSDMLFKHGDAGSETADSTIQVGTTAGTIDVSNAAANTVGEIVDVINASDNWEAVLIDSLRADTSTAKFLTAAAASANTYFDVNSDTSAALYLTVSLQNEGLPSDNDDDSGQKNNIVEIQSTNTYGSGSSTISVYSCVGSTETQVYSKAGGATTVEQTISFDDIGHDGGIGARTVVRMTGSAACTGQIQLRGKSYSCA